ncbi:MAG TPA: alanine dehydrogenase [Acidobacteriota bacterium]|nr:alanine dehydrogenase [Acidobacteriota bacterium]
MKIGVVTEIKPQENRVGLVPAGVRQATAAGAEVLVESGAGIGSGLPDDQYLAAGARLIDKAADVWAESDLIIKVKEPVPAEFDYLRPNLVLYTYLHLAPLPELTQALLDNRVTGIAYETVELADGSLPLLVPMSEIAGRMSVQVGAHFLEKAQGGRGVLLGGVPGVNPADVVVIGGGIVGRNAARVAYGMGAHVTVLDNSPRVLQYIDDVFGGHVNTIMSHATTVEAWCLRADLLVGAVLVTGAAAPNVVPREVVSRMKDGAVIVDVAVDQGGCIETTRATTHREPTFVVDGVVHYGVTNMPGAVPRTSTFGLTNVTAAYLTKLASVGVEDAVRDDPALARGVNTYGGHVTCAPVAVAQGREHTPLDELL